MSDIQNFLKSLICDLTSPDEGRSLNLNVILTPSDEVIKLRQQINDLQIQHEQLLTQFHRTEYLYCCEVLINTQITDYIQDLGVDLPKRLFKTRTD